jgi:glycosyltransferase involved in cell wall biosynthesis
MVRVGIEVVVACLREDVLGTRALRPQFESLGIRVVKLRGGGRYNVWFPAHLIGLIEQEKPDVVHTHLPRADWAGAIAKRLRGKAPLVSSVHDIHEFWAGRWTMPLCEWAWRQADAIIAISEAVRGWLIDSRRMPSEKITVIRYGLKLENRGQENREYRGTVELAGRPIIGSVGRLEPRKGHDCLVRAMPIVLRAVPDACLVIAGGDPWGYRRQLEALICELGMENNVRLLGFVSDVESFLGAIDVFAFSSRLEGLGQVILEAMLAGKPIVASRIPAITEIISHGVTGLLARPDDEADFARSIISLLRDRDTASAMGQRARRHVDEKWGIEEATKRLIELYGRLRPS